MKNCLLPGFFKSFLDKYLLFTFKCYKFVFRCENIYCLIPGKTSIKRALPS